MAMRSLSSCGIAHCASQASPLLVARKLYAPQSWADRLTRYRCALDLCTRIINTGCCGGPERRRRARSGLERPSSGRFHVSDPASFVTTTRFPSMVSTEMTAARRRVQITSSRTSGDASTNFVTVDRASNALGAGHVLSGARQHIKVAASTESAAISRTDVIAVPVLRPQVSQHHRAPPMSTWIFCTWSECHRSLSYSRWFIGRSLTISSESASRARRTKHHKHCANSAGMHSEPPYRTRRRGSRQLHTPALF
jgi:hypothetical protein